eukprot:4092655-Pleurochrysis_carterae.AAC.5
MARLLLVAAVAHVAMAAVLRGAVVRGGIAALSSISLNRLPLRAEDAVPPSSDKTAFDFDVPFRGEPTEIKPFLGRATLVVNVKFDDPITLDQMPGFQALLNRYSSKGLHVLAFPTDQVKTLHKH